MLVANVRTLVVVACAAFAAVSTDEAIRDCWIAAASNCFFLALKSATAAIRSWAKVSCFVWAVSNLFSALAILEAFPDCLAASKEARAASADRIADIEDCLADSARLAANFTSSRKVSTEATILLLFAATSCSRAARYTALLADRSVLLSASLCSTVNTEVATAS